MFCKNCGSQIENKEKFCGSCGTQVSSTGSSLKKSVGPLFQGIGGKLAETGQNVTQKTKNMAEVAKLKRMISDEGKKIKSCFEQIGELCYTAKGEICEKEFASLSADIDESKKKIVTYEEQIVEVKGS